MTPDREAEAARYLYTAVSRFLPVLEMVTGLCRVAGFDAARDELTVCQSYATAAAGELAAIVHHRYGTGGDTDTDTAGPQDTGTEPHTQQEAQ